MSNPNILLDTTDIAASFYSAPIYEIANHAGFCVHAIITGTMYGTMTLEGSIDGENWFKIKDTEVALAGSAIDTPYNIADAFYLMARVAIAVESGAGTIKILFSTKERS